MVNKSVFPRAVWIIYFLFLSVAIFLVLYIPKIELQLLINQFHSAFFDAFFKYLTYLGDGIVFGIAIVAFFFIDKKESLKYVLTGLLTLALVALFKQIIFSGLPRPVAVIGSENLHLIEGVKMARKNSLPSGHTTTIFAIITILILWFKNKYMQVALLILAILTGFSRVYLSQHFLLDVISGSILGIVIAYLGIYLTDKIYQYYARKKLNN